MAEQIEARDTGSHEKLDNIISILQNSNEGVERGIDSASDSNNQIVNAVLDSAEAAEDTTAAVEEGTKEQKKASSYFKWMRTFQERMAKRALEMGSRIKKWGGEQIDKIKKSAGSLLDLLMKGLGLAALFMLFDWIEKADFEKLLEDVKKKWEEIKVKWEEIKAKFNEIVATLDAAWQKVKDTMTAVRVTLDEWSDTWTVFSTTVAEWAKLMGAWAIAGGPAFRLWKWIKAIFGPGMAIAILATTVTEWAGKKLFDIGTGTLALLWKGIKGIFGIGGTIGLLVAEVAIWAGKSLFNVTTGTLSLLWKGIKGIFGIGGSIMLLADDIQSKWTKTPMFGPEGALRRAWTGLKGIFGAGKNAMIAKFLIFVDNIKAFTGFGPDGAFIRMWNGIKGFFGVGGKLAASPGFLMTAEEMIDARKIGLHADGPLKTMWKSIKNIFSAEGKIGQFAIWAKKSMSSLTWFDDGGHFRQGWNTIKGVFGADSSVFSKMWAWFGKLNFNFAGEGSALKNAFGWFGGLFTGETSIFGSLSKSLSTWAGTFKSWFAMGEGGGPISKFFGFMGGIADNIKTFTKAMINNPIVKGIKTFFMGALKTIGRIFYPIGWVIGIFEALSGFWEGFKDKGGELGEEDTRTFGEKMMDGLKGALNNLINFFAVDTVMMVQDVLNWAIDKWNNSFLGSMKTIEKFTFGDDTKKWAEETMDKIIPSISEEEQKRRRAIEGDQAVRKKAEALAGEQNKSLWKNEAETKELMAQARKERKSVIDNTKLPDANKVLGKKEEPQGMPAPANTAVPIPSGMKVLPVMMVNPQNVASAGGAITYAPNVSNSNSHQNYGGSSSSGDKNAATLKEG